MTQVSAELQKRIDQVSGAWSEARRDPSKDSKKVVLAMLAKMKDVATTMTEGLHTELEEHALALKEEMQELARQQQELLNRQQAIRSLCRHNDDPDNESCYYCGSPKTPYWAE